MPKVVIEEHENLAVLRLDNGVINAISPDLVDDLSAALKQVKDEFYGTVLAGGVKFFSMGFSLPDLLRLDRAGMEHFIYNFSQAAFDFLVLPMPTACAIAGHVIAAGSILALMSDYRFAASGKKLIGLNEVKLGLPTPYLADLMLRQIVGDRAATDMLYRGEFIASSEAQRIGLIDEILPEDKVEARALEKIAELAALPRKGFVDIKANRIEDARLRYEENYRSKTEYFLDCWFSEPTQELLTEAAKKF
jgi:enoyl-CoA hydratase/carnithine racemase